MKTLQKTPIALAVAMAGSVMLSGCGGSSSGGDDETDNLVSRGMITGFGSVYVNGLRFHTGGARIEVDDIAGSENDLRVGMIVTVRGSSDDNGVSWDAASIEYDNELKGPISAIDPGADAGEKLLTVLGQTVVLNLDTTIDADHGLTFDSIAVDDVVEVSGYRTAAGLVATHIEKQDNADEIEIKGLIEGLDADSFTIGGFDVSYDGTTELEDIVSLDDGLYVEVEGQLDGAGTTLIADKIEAEDDGYDDDEGEFEMAGVVYDYDAGNDSFRIQNLLVDAATAELSPSSLALADGITVKVKGFLQNGVLIADEIEQKGKKVEINAVLSAVGANSVTFSFAGGDITARVNVGTELEDDTGNPVSVIGDFSPGDYVELEAYDDGADALNAVEIERQSPDRVEVEAPVEAFDETGQTVQLLGVSFDLSAVGEFENSNDVSISEAAFYGALEPGVFIKLEDDDVNGVFEKAELEF